jgi:DNA modification methylase
MAGRFRERTWSVIPSPTQWAKIKAALDTPDDLEPCWAEREGLGNDYKPVSDCRAFTIGKEPKPDHPSPKPLAVMRWFLEVIGAENYLDPFMGSGTTGVAAVEAGRRFVGIERDPAHFDVACHRISDALARPDLFIDRPVRAEKPPELQLSTGRP